VDVVIIDDHPLIHETLSAMVHKAIPGARIHVESELGAALAHGKGLADFRVALLDLGLPGYTGIEALLRFRKAFPDVRVIVVSATDDPITMERAIAAGAAWYLPKTAQPYAMIAAIKSVAGV
jgi:DNA-binding NarL/FixJ family response regulator